MRRDHLAHQLRVTRAAIEGRPNGIAMAEIAACDGHNCPRAEKRCKSLFQKLG
jgi:hypothetical protein